MALLKITAKKYIQRVSVIWSSPVLDWNKVKSTNEFALSTFVYLMWTQRWPLTKLRQIDQRLRKIIVANGGRHPTSSNAICQGALAEEAWKERGRLYETSKNEKCTCKVRKTIALYCHICKCICKFVTLLLPSSSL